MSSDEALTYADDDGFWPVSEITAERPREYRVKWEGVNPKTGEPWEESWVPKRDCTADLVAKWKRSRAGDRASADVVAVARKVPTKSKKTKLATTPSVESRAPSSDVPKSRLKSRSVDQDSSARSPSRKPPSSISSKSKAPTPALSAKIGQKRKLTKLSEVEGSGHGSIPRKKRRIQRSPLPEEEEEFESDPPARETSGHDTRASRIDSHTSRSVDTEDEGEVHALLNPSTDNLSTIENPVGTSDIKPQIFPPPKEKYGPPRAYKKRKKAASTVPNDQSSISSNRRAVDTVEDDHEMRQPSPEPANEPTRIEPSVQRRGVPKKTTSSKRIIPLTSESDVGEVEPSHAGPHSSREEPSVKKATSSPGIRQGGRIPKKTVSLQPADPIILESDTDEAEPSRSGSRPSRRHSIEKVASAPRHREGASPQGEGASNDPQQDIIEVVDDSQEGDDLHSGKVKTIDLSTVDQSHPLTSAKAKSDIRANPMLAASHDQSRPSESPGLPPVLPRSSSGAQTVAAALIRNSIANDDSLIPETNTQSSVKSRTNSQSQKSNLFPSASQHEGPATSPPVLSVSTKSPEVVQKKPSDTGSKKPMGPVPVVSENVFKANFPNIAAEEEEEDDSIQQFSSPVKPRASPVKSSQPFPAKEVVELPKSTKKRQLPWSTTRDTTLASSNQLQVIPSPPTSSRSNDTPIKSTMLPAAPVRRHARTESDLGPEIGKAVTAPEPPINEELVRQMEDGYIDPDRGATAQEEESMTQEETPNLAPCASPHQNFEPEEEEETTQDVLDSHLRFLGVPPLNEEEESGSYHGASKAPSPTRSEQANRVDTSRPPSPMDAEVAEPPAPSNADTTSPEDTTVPVQDAQDVREEEILPFHATEADFEQRDSPAPQPNDVKAKLRMLTSANETLTRRCGELLRQIQTLKEEEVKRTEDRDKLAESSESLRASLESHERIAQELRESIKELQTARDELLEQVDAHKKLEASWRLDQVQLQQTLDSLTASKAAQDIQLEMAHAEYQALSLQQGELQQKLDDAEQSFKTLDTEVATVRASVEELSSSKQSLETSLAQALDEKMKLAQRHSTDEAKQAPSGPSSSNEHLKALADLRAAQEAKAAKLRELYEESMREAQETAAVLRVYKVDDQTSSIAESNTLRRELSNLIEEDLTSLSLDELVARLKRKLSDYKTRNSELIAEKETISNARNDLATKLETAEKDKSLAESNNVSLSATVEALTQSKTSAEKDVDLFRKMYGEASQYVSEVRAENKALEKRASIAESQAQDGLANIRAFYETQVSTLKMEVTRLRKISEIEAARDTRTDDEVRRRAAEEPELRRELAKLKIRNLELEQRQREQLRTSYARQEHAFLERQRDAWRVEALALRQSADETESSSGSKDVVYICQWRIGEAGDLCPGNFTEWDNFLAHMEAHCTQTP